MFCGLTWPNAKVAVWALVERSLLCLRRCGRHAATFPSKGTTLKKISYSLLSLAIAAAGIALPVTSASAEDRGGWSEQEGAFVNQEAGLRAGLSVAAAATPRHTGKSETATINGTTHKRSHGWTTWTGVYHYTTAQLEHVFPASGVITTSGRKWGTSGTEAVTKYVAFSPSSASDGYGIARTYYGK